MDNMNQNSAPEGFEQIEGNREQVIVRTSIIGIAANVALAAFKAVIGLLAHSIAVVLDAVNNLSDALSSIVTILGSKLSSRKPDRKHPMGHGRIEYLSALTVAVIVLYAGIQSLVESVKKIIHPETPSYNAVGLVIIGAAVLVKIVLGRYVKAKGTQVNSSALEASGSDAMFDAVLSFSVLVSALIFMFTGLSLEAYVGVVIAGFILKAGVEMLLETVDDIVGKRADPELSQKIRTLLNEEPEVRGAFDLLIDNYGPDRYYATVHLELPDTMTVEEVDRLTRRVQQKVFLETGVVLTGVGVYSYNTTNTEAAHLRNLVQEQVMSHDWVLQMHGFYADTEEKDLRFDVVTSFDVKAEDALKALHEEIQAICPGYRVQITPDKDLAD